VLVKQIDYSLNNILLCKITCILIINVNTLTLSNINFPKSLPLIGSSWHLKQINSDVAYSMCFSVFTLVGYITFTQDRGMSTALLIDVLLSNESKQTLTVKTGWDDV